MNDSAKYFLLSSTKPVVRQSDGRSRLSEFWIPTGGISKKSGTKDAGELLVRGGFLRQAYSGVFHMLPLGLRVQEKMNGLIDKHMRSLGASKLSLSSISSQALWKKSGRLTKDSEFFRFEDRKGTPLLLAPTHEEEITSLVGMLTKSYRDFPLRVYQISRKYRDEARPRHGLLRGREFIMKDLYTFDSNIHNAMETYNSVKEAYIRLFNELKLPYLVAAADSGTMGGSHSHEFHMPNAKGEDTIIKCTSCGHVYNEELSDGKTGQGSVEQQTNSKPDNSAVGMGSQQAPAISTDVWISISKDGKTLVRAYYPKFLMNNTSAEPSLREINSHALKSIATASGVDLDTSVKTPLAKWQAKAQQSQQDTGSSKTSGMSILDIYDFRVRPFDRPPLSGLESKELLNEITPQYSRLDSYPGTNSRLDLIRATEGDECQSCGEPNVVSQNSIELAHTFHLGTRYSKVLLASVTLPEDSKNPGNGELCKASVPLEMGCHGIGVSRMISTIADTLADSKGLNWPRAIAPFELVIVPVPGLETGAVQVYDELKMQQGESIDAVLDDREKGFGWKLSDADLIGYPIIVVVGKGWEKGEVEVQCRRLNNLREKISLKVLRSHVKSLLNKL
ncbi:proline-tRNA ligase [Polytolypa hystricis UAMH7299]|uniref:proline--tRNA ligase n=1 Tax=Polytolypa hystricis (strain UAMH7299) TaxID=1447883 RepID=A0A2B7XTU2_POLH7|nr:proline-tRNA ligase [Polytolypa hystricis UAMH7299]